MSLTINVRHLEDKDIHLQGELAAADLELSESDELVKPRLPLHYQLTAHLAGQDVLVSGKLEITLDCECARCLKPFATRVTVPDWLLHLAADDPEKPVLQNDVVDLTPFLREAILLEFPQHPLCDSRCAGLPRQADVDSRKKKDGASLTSEASAWAELNKLKF
jgi:uncharacterized protein